MTGDQRSDGAAMHPPTSAAPTSGPPPDLPPLAGGAHDAGAPGRSPGEGVGAALPFGGGGLHADAPVGTGDYSQHHPRWLRPRVSTYWWLARWPYFKFILRELSSVFVAWFVVFFLLLVGAAGRGEAAYQRFLDWAGHPIVVIVNVIALMFVVFHAVTWFNLAPQAMAVRFRGKRVGKLWIAAPNYVAWAVASAVVVWLLVGRQ